MSEPYWRDLGKQLLTQINSADDLALLIVDLQMEHRKMAFEANQQKAIRLVSGHKERMNQDVEDISYID